MGQDNKAARETKIKERKREGEKEQLSEGREKEKKKKSDQQMTQEGDLNNITRERETNSLKEIEIHR